MEEGARERDGETEGVEKEEGRLAKRGEREAE